ncbi:flagellar biosynthesis regulator FlaF [Aestuariispira ectoiniformans]|uniref:flagellar biosynthesis regulator FlaF n=1 Tax=Aestuariispira ectoiniformans TaxID=2775080 RepID=UPI00223C42DB|nr:flagellar biosynthesis regulator FlaF [Aestuariispira ectoiniformans]
MNNPYAQQQRSALEHASPQAAEGYALIEMARRLEKARQAPDDIENILVQTRLNWRIWTIIQSELVDPDCQVPREIRENLINLSNFIDKRSTEILATPDAAKLQVLININRQIGAGLMGNPGDGVEAQNADSDNSQDEKAADTPAAALDSALSSDQEV